MQKNIGESFGFGGVNRREDVVTVQSLLTERGLTPGRSDGLLRDRKGWLVSRLLAVKLTPKASSDRIGQVRTLPDGQEQLAVYVTAAPEKGKANEALLRLLAQHLGVPPSSLKIVRGHTARTKLIEIGWLGWARWRSGTI
jgi:uncharacterized protein